jgi:hypothetical protein
MKNFARSKVGSLLVVALLLLGIPFVPSSTEANGVSKPKDKNARYKSKIVKGEAAALRAKELRTKNKGIARAMKDLEQKGFRQAFDQSVSVLAVKDTQISQAAPAVIRPAAFQSETFYNDGYEMTFVAYDDGNPNTWEGVVYEHDPDMLEYEYTVTFDISGEPSTWAPIVETYYPSDGSAPVSSDDPLYYDPSYEPYDPARRYNYDQQLMTKGDSMRSPGVFFMKASFAPNAVQGSRWRDRLYRWSKCVVGSCTAAAIGCTASGPGWVGCWTAWCGGAEVGCVIMSW